MVYIDFAGHRIVDRLHYHQIIPPVDYFFTEEVSIIYYDV